MPVLPVLPDWWPFVRVQSGNRVILDYVRDDVPFTEQHCAFLVDDAHLRRRTQAKLLDGHIPIWADPFPKLSGEINHLSSGRGVYFDDPDGHLMESITAPCGDTPKLIAPMSGLGRRPRRITPTAFRLVAVNGTYDTGRLFAFPQSV